jgi:hypothetical protein
MRDPEHIDMHRLEQDAGNFLVGFGEALLNESEIDLEQLTASHDAEEDEVRIERITRPPERVRIAGGPYGEGGQQRAAFLATIGVEVSPGDRDIDLRIEFELDLEDGEIAPSPNFEVTEITLANPGD